MKKTGLESRFEKWKAPTQAQITVFKTENDGTWFCSRIDIEALVNQELKANDKKWRARINGELKDILILIQKVKVYQNPKLFQAIKERLLKYEK